MAFQPLEMTEATLRRLVDNLVKFNKKSPLPATPKRSQLQEAVAATLGFPTYHAAITSLKTAKAEKPAPSKISASSDKKGEWIVPLYAMGPEAVPFPWKAKISQEDTNRVALVSDEVFANSALFRGTERDRRNWLSGLIAANPDRAIFVVQGPMSLPIKNIRAQSVSFPGQDQLEGVASFFSAAELINIFVILLDNLDPAGPENETWRPRAISLLSSVITVLVYARDHLGVELHTPVIKESLDLERLMGLAQDERIPSTLSAPIQAYLSSLAKYNPDLPCYEQAEETCEQHRFLEDQLVDLFKAQLGYLSNRVPLIARLLSRKSLRFPERIDHKEKEEKRLQPHVESWLRDHPNGLLVFDVPPLDSTLWEWFTLRLPHWLDSGAAVWLGVQSTSDIPAASGPLVNRLAYRLEISK